MPCLKFGCCDDTPPPPPYGLVVRARGCGCGCYDPDIDPPFPGWTGQSGTPLYVCGYTVTIKSGGTTVATCTAGSTYPCDPCRFLGLASGTYTIIITHPRYATSTTTYVYSSPSAADRIYTVTLCTASGYHCIGCAEPASDTLSLDITRDLSFLSGLGGTDIGRGPLSAIIGSIPTDGMSVALTWQEWPHDHLAVCGSELRFTLNPRYGWYGSGTTDAVPVATWIDKTTKLPCDFFIPPYPVGECFNGDCSHWDITYQPVTLWFWLVRCSNIEASSPYGNVWTMHIYGPPAFVCHGGPYCDDRSAFFLSDDPLPIGIEYTCGADYCDVVTSTQAALNSRVTGLPTPQPCNPLNLEFEDWIDPTDISMGKAVWGVVS